ncbi:DUF4833 domain-containing protein [Tolypothrix bouteillei VB521301_2]|uniref:DUF4833 domain-containing protein n=1 Tax=Tolypothrix bouteillei TaxID=1246981 RepID=UPI000513A5C2
MEKVTLFRGLRTSREKSDKLTDSKDLKVNNYQNGDMSMSGNKINILGLANFVIVFSASPSLANDVSNIFYISNSDTDSKVTYGIRLDSNCLPTGSNPVYYYWLRTNGSTRKLNNIEESVYGISSQSSLGNNVTFRINGFQNRGIQNSVAITSSKSNNGGCQSQAFTTINGVQTQLSYAYVQARSKEVAGIPVQFRVLNVTLIGLNQQSETIPCRSNCTIGLP